MGRTKKAWINATLLVVTLIINIMGSIGLINGTSQKEVSDRYFTLPLTFGLYTLKNRIIDEYNHSLKL